ncbi:hypothetical protein EW145_g1587 [Phellinidium pouzarii]|uniref:Uncharacterized protein n=1 Tax=Phellinidium pouzarii TaxID=167371 RepID=A0A4V3XDK2_9AGAM|nr:hypothetical protein EW145_g1587 [Phellinidium pouzarii]
MNTNSRNRDSVADLEEELYEIFTTHHESHANDSGEPAVPASALVDVIRIFGENHDGMKLLSDDEESKLDDLVSANPGLEVTPTILLGFLAVLTAQSPKGSHDENPFDLQDRGSQDDAVNSNDEENNGQSSRSSSRGPAPKTPSSARLPDSPFDSGRRQRTAPLQHAVPSSWNSKRALQIGRRRSDAGNYERSMSDSESATPSRPSSRARARAPSNPTSPYSSHVDLWGASSPPMRPSSRTHSHGQYSMSMSAQNFDNMSPNERARFEYDHGDSFERSLQHASDGDSDDDVDDGEDPTLGLRLERSVSASMAHVSREREEALERTNQDLQRRVVEQDRILQRKIAEHESELEEMENMLEETKSELNAKMREEKELRAKETRYIHQISALESEIAERQRTLEASKSAYQSLQKQYQEQCTEAENLRNTLRTRDQQVRESGDKITLHGLEINKWQQQQDQMEQHAQHLEAQLVAAREAQTELDEQKQENMLLKETIDRMRFDMDELRIKADGSIPVGSGRDSIHGSIGKSLGVELQRINGKWPGEADTDEDDTTAVSDGGSGSADTEGEDVVQTIITRRKKKVASRAMKRVETIEYEDVKHYSDAYTQHEVSEFSVSSMTQTEPEPKKPTASFSTQTESTSSSPLAIQTDPIPTPPPIVTAEIEIQTDALEVEGSRSVTPEEGMASSSSTLHPPTPKPIIRDLPPSYAESSKSGDEQEQHDMRVAAETIRKWHKGVDLPLSPIRGGVSEDLVEEWTTLKGEMGFECLAIDKVLEMSLKTGPRDGARSEDSSAASSSTPPKARKNRFYNIYNTFVYGRTDEEADRDRSLAAGLTQAAVVLGVCVLAAGVLSGPYMQPHYHVPGGPSYYDRAAWSEFNRLYPVGEGLVPDGAATVWNFIGRVGGEAARMARGWPT